MHAREIALPRPPWQTIVIGGLVAGTLDLTAALVINGLKGIPPVRILQGIAGGLLGLPTYDGGAPTAGLGVLLHYGIMTVICAVFFFAASRKLDILIRHPLVFGPLYGIAVYLVMNFVVLPLSAFPHHLAYPPTALLTGFAVHVVCIGLPIALIVKHMTAAR